MAVFTADITHSCNALGTPAAHGSHPREIPTPSSRKSTVFALTTATPARTPSSIPAKSAAMASHTAPAVRKPAKVRASAPIAKRPTMTVHARTRNDGRRETYT